MTSSTVKVSCNTSASATLTNGFSYTSGGTGAVPTIATTAPSSGPAGGGTIITISGTGFLAGATVTVNVTEAPAFLGLRYRGLRPGMDVVVLERGGRLAYDLHFEAGADPSTLAIACDGVDSLELRAPNDGAVLGGRVLVDGTAWDPCFTSYEVEFRPLASSVFSPVASCFLAILS